MMKIYILDSIFILLQLGNPSHRKDRFKMIWARVPITLTFQVKELLRHFLFKKVGGKHTQ